MFASSWDTNAGGFAGIVGRLQAATTRVGNARDHLADTGRSSSSGRAGKAKLAWPIRENVTFALATRASLYRAALRPWEVLSSVYNVAPSLWRALQALQGPAGPWDGALSVGGVLDPVFVGSSVAHLVVGAVLNAALFHSRTTSRTPRPKGHSVADVVAPKSW